MSKVLEDKSSGAVSEVSVVNLRKVLQKYQEDVGQFYRDIEKNRLGKILTIVDGSFSDETQRKAVKDMINGVWYRPIESIGTTCPHVSQVTEALGFQLWELTDGPPPLPETKRYNPYKELVN